MVFFRTHLHTIIADLSTSFRVGTSGDHGPIFSYPFLGGRFKVVSVLDWIARHTSNCKIAQMTLENAEGLSIELAGRF